MSVTSRTFVATPAYRGEVVMQYAHCLVRDTVLAMAQGLYVEAPFGINDTYIQFARNYALRRFLETDMDHLMFIDADMSWSPGALGEILALPAEMDIVGGVYRTKEDEAYYPVNALGPLSFPLCELAGVATGFMRITRKAAQAMAEAFEDPFWIERIGGEPFGEDMLFCRRARELGLKVWGKFDIAFDHIGPHAWSGTAQDHFRAGAAAKAAAASSAA